MLDSAKHTKPPISSERSFGVVFCVVLLLIGCWPLLSGSGVRWLFLVLAAVLALVTWFKPVWLTKPNLVWYKFGLLLGAIVAPIVMSLVFIITVIPIGLLAKLMGKDMLDVRLDKTANTYWKERTEPMQTFDKQY